MLEAEDLLDADVEARRTEERLRIIAAVECQAHLANAALKLQARSVVALERQAAALEALVACTQKRGLGWASTFLQRRRLNGADDGKPGLFIRVGTGGKTFACVVDDWEDDNGRQEVAVDSAFDDWSALALTCR